MSRQCRHISESVHLKRRSVVLRTPRRRKAPRSRSVDGVLRGRGAAAARQVALSRLGRHSRTLAQATLHPLRVAIWHYTAELWQLGRRWRGGLQRHTMSSGPGYPQPD